MPRKLPQHSELVLFFLRKTLPKKWRIKKIHNLNEKKVFYYLGKSKIFLSFTHFEGLGMPPIEAALSGNKVIGYTGEGGKEDPKKISKQDFGTLFLRALKKDPTQSDSRK